MEDGTGGWHTCKGFVFSGLRGGDPTVPSCAVISYTQHYPFLYFFQYLYRGGGTQVGTVGTGLCFQRLTAVPTSFEDGTVGTRHAFGTLSALCVQCGCDVGKTSVDTVDVVCYTDTAHRQCRQ